MKLFLLLITLFFVADFRSVDDEVVSVENSFSQLTHEHIIVLQTIKSDRTFSRFSIDPHISGTKLDHFFLRTNVFSKISFYFYFVENFGHLSEWGPQSLATPPPVSFC
jgi:hypothetical protein